jgi:hypothetical protein
MAAELGWIALACALGFVLSLLLERLLQPGTRPFWQRPLAATLLHLGVWLAVFSFEIAVFQRPWFAAAAVSSFMLLLVLVNNAKFHSLREPFVFQDFEYFSDAIKHPRLYLPFLGWGRALLAALAFGVAIYAGMALEPTLSSRLGGGAFILMLLGLLALAGLLIVLGARQLPPVTFDPAADLHALGLMASLWQYGRAERHPHALPPTSGFKPPVLPATERPHLVVVQSESFFDVRRLFDGIRPAVLQAFDTIQSEAYCHGQIDVPAWGANTVRSEFAFLSGLDGAALGVHRFNPYRKLARQGVPTLASFLRLQGYRTVCVHPYPASFYARDTVYPLLGFDEFIDIRAFDTAAKTGPYVGDVALAEAVCKVLQADSAQPVFVFVITMENHGPLHLESVQADDVARLYSTPPPQGCEDLTIYLRHLANADSMIRRLRQAIDALPGKGVLCWYGDHVPILPKVYAALGTPAGQTDYFVWSKGGVAAPLAAENLKIETLACRVLQQMGLLKL